MKVKAVTSRDTTVKVFRPRPGELKRTSAGKLERWMSFDGWERDGKDVSFWYTRWNGDRYRHVLKGKCLALLEDSSSSSHALTGIGLALVPWLWQAWMPQVIFCAASHLTPCQLSLWTQVYRHSIGEFLWVNRRILRLPELGARTIPEPGSFFRIVSPDDAPVFSPADDADSGCTNSLEPKVLLPLGGGKDSLVLLERLRSAGIEPDLMFCGGEVGEFDGNWRYKAVVDAVGGSAGSGLELLELDFPDADRWWGSRTAGSVKPEGFAWAALIAFVASLVSILKGHNAVVVGNERSANLGNGIMMGLEGPDQTELNHQYDKSACFERDVASYLARFVSPSLTYFSGLSDLYEVQIMQRFACTPKYFPVFFSCNEPIGPGSSEWCGVCPKCLFVFVLLTAFAPSSEIIPNPFREDPLENPDNFATIDSLAGAGGAKPMDCVGTPEETLLALFLGRRRRLECNENLPLYFHSRTEVVESGAEQLALLDSRASGTFPTWFRAD